MAAFVAPPCGLPSWNTQAATVTARPAPGSLHAPRPPTTALSALATGSDAGTAAVPAPIPEPGATVVAPAVAVTALNSARELVTALSAYLSTPGVAPAVSVVKFHAPSCRSCAGVRVKYERMALAYATQAAKEGSESDQPLEEGAGQPGLPAAVACYAMDVGRHAELCSRLGVDQLPYFMVTRGERRVFARAVAWNRFDDVRAAVDAAVHDETPSAVVEATSALPAEPTDPAETVDMA